jgi:hypothetical protein
MADDARTAAGGAQGGFNKRITVAAESGHCLESKRFFFEKKKQKTFWNLGHGRWTEKAHGPDS